MSSKIKRTVTITQEYQIDLPEEYSDASLLKILNDINRMYDIHGNRIIDAMDAESDYQFTRVVSIDGENVFCYDTSDGRVVSDAGFEIILDGQEFSGENNE